jgi:hypothetical protein
MLCGTTYAQMREEWTRERRAAGRYDDTIDFFRVRYVELTEWHLAWDWDLDLAIRERPILDIDEIATTEEELERILARWLRDPAQLRAPASVHYPDPPRSR